jgi:protein-L-isoaspartate(D-aspartate) O-methyltransferase
MEPRRRTPSEDRASSGFAELRADLVREVARRSGVTDDAILSALSAVPRHRFVPDESLASAYLDRALPIGFGQTISQPSMVALMLAELELGPDHRVLEVGAGSGYAAALLGTLAAEVYAIEIVSELSRRARALLAELGFDNVTIVDGNGRAGYPERAPYDRIVVSAAADEVPTQLIAELAPGGRMVMPVGDEGGQELLVGDKSSTGEIAWRRSVACVFVPLVSE